MVKERPILFSTAMVRALLAGNKTQTRRVIKPQPQEPGVLTKGDGNWRVLGRGGLTRVFGWEHDCPYGKPGDRLWVRENFTFINADRERHELCIGYDADGLELPNRPSFYVTEAQYADFMGDERTKLDPFERRKYSGMFMNRFFSRITLEVTEIRVQRLQEISEEDALAEGLLVHQNPQCQLGVGRYMYTAFEGVHSYWELTARKAYADLWESINGPGSWDLNPWVWALSFSKVQKVMP